MYHEEDNKEPEDPSNKDHRKGCSFRGLLDFYRLPMINNRAYKTQWNLKREKKTILAMMELLLYLTARPIRAFYIEWVSSITRHAQEV